MIRERGTIATGSARLVRLLVRGEVVATHREHGPVTVLLEDASSLVVEIAETASMDGEVTKHRGAWSELRETPVAGGFARDLVQPFTEVELHEIAFQHGTVVSLRGELLAPTFGEDGEPTAPHSTLRADRIAAGPFAEKLVDAMRDPAVAKIPVVLDPGDPASHAGISAALIVVFALAATTIAIAMATGMSSPSALIAGTTYLGFFFALRSRRSVPKFWSRDQLLDGRDYGFAIVPAIALATIVLCFFGTDEVTLWWTAGWLAIALAGIAALLLANRPSFRALRELVRAHGSLGAWRTVEGTIDGGAEGVVFRSETTTHVALDSEGEDRVEGRKVSGKHRFAIASAEGAIAVDRDEIIWASTHGVHPDHGAARGQGVTDEDHVLHGGQIAAAGKVDRNADGSLALRSAGTRPVVVLATGPAGKPLALAKALIAARRTSLVGLIVTVAAIAALGARFGS